MFINSDKESNSPIKEVKGKPIASKMENYHEPVPDSSVDNTRYTTEEKGKRTATQAEVEAQEAENYKQTGFIVDSFNICEETNSSEQASLRLARLLQEEYDADFARNIQKQEKGEQVQEEGEQVQEVEQSDYSVSETSTLKSGDSKDSDKEKFIKKIDNYIRDLNIKKEQADKVVKQSEVENYVQNLEISEVELFEKKEQALSEIKGKRKYTDYTDSKSTDNLESKSTDNLESKTKYRKIQPKN